MNGKLPFSVDGIRGKVNSWPLNRSGCIYLGKALGEYIKSLALNPLVMIARDTRPSSPNLYNYVRQGLIYKDIQIEDLGVTTTPALAYLVRNNPASLGIMITASHNPVDFNGIKIFSSSGRRLSDDASSWVEKYLGLLEDTIEDDIEYSNPKFHPNNKFAKKYINDQIDQANLVSLKGMHLLLDCANGSPSNLIPNAFNKLGAAIQVVNQFKGNNIINFRCGTEYFRIHLSEFSKIVQDSRVDYGISFDGDGDRLIVVDHNGNLFNGDDFLFALAGIFSRSGSLTKNTVVTSYMSNSGLISSLKALNVNVVQTHNGDKYLEDQISQNNYYLGGEQFGNIIIHDEYHIAADPFYALLYIMKEAMTSSLSLLVEHLKKWPQVLATLKIDWQNDDQFRKQIETTIKILGAGSRVRTWRSSTEPGLFNVMVEGSEECTYKLVLEETNRLCKSILRQDKFEGVITPLSERKY